MVLNDERIARDKQLIERSIAVVVVFIFNLVLRLKHLN